MTMLMRLLIVSIAVWATGLSPARADLLVENPRHPFGGPDSDTDFIYGPVDPFWQVLADDFLMNSSAQVDRVTWLGFYGGQFYGSIQPPVGDETMRIRFHAARPGDGLPGQVLYEQDFLNTSRTASGLSVCDTRCYYEFRFEANLATPFPIEPNMRYWIEIAQVGIQSSEFRWEYSVPPDGTSFASMNIDFPDWHRSTAASNLAFQLWGTPEPSSAALLLIPTYFVLRYSRGGRRPRKTVTHGAMVASCRMKTTVSTFLIGLAMMAVNLSVARANLLFENPPLNTGGPASDTDFIYGPVDPFWQVLADDFLINSSAQVDRVTWLGFYGGQFEGSIQPPVGDETMRIRFHAERPGDGLPGQVLYEQDFLNTSRTATGLLIGDTRIYYEFRFEADLATLLPIEPNVRYWIEIAQLGIQSSTFRWEYSVQIDGPSFVSRNQDYPDWNSGFGNLAFQLWGTPEPHTVALMLIPAFLVSRSARGVRRPVERRALPDGLGGVR